MSKVAKKTRTRGHIIADMSVHHLGYRVVRCGYTFQATEADYGYDGSIVTFDKDGQVENANIWVQLKATESLRKSADGSKIRFSISNRDIKHWQDEPFPAYLVIFDAKDRKAYWLYLQRYFQKHNVRAETMTHESLTVEASAKRIVTLAAVRRWRRHKERVLKKLGAVDHA